MLKKIRLFNIWKKTLYPIKFELEQKFNIRIDKAKRLYTVVNVPEELIGEAYSLKKQDIDRISENYIRGFSSELTQFLNSKGMQELFQIYEIKKVDKYSYLLIIGFRLFKSHNYYNILYYVLTPIIIISSLISLFLLF